MLSSTQHTFETCIANRSRRVYIRKSRSSRLITASMDTSFLLAQNRRWSRRFRSRLHCRLRQTIRTQTRWIEHRRRLSVSRAPVWCHHASTAATEGNVILVPLVGTDGRLGRTAISTAKLPSARSSLAISTNRWANSISQGVSIALSQIASVCLGFCTDPWTIWILLPRFFFDNHSRSI
jgi:hypothetical protein